GPSVKYFIWGYQLHFHVSARIEAEKLLQQLDPRFDPELFLVGVLEDKREGAYPICVVPDDCKYQPEAFAGVHQTARIFAENDPDKKIFRTHPVAEESANRRRQLRAVWKAVSQTIDHITDPFERL